MNIVELIVFIFILALMGFLLISLVKLSFINKKIRIERDQLHSDKVSLVLKLGDMLNAQDTSRLSQTESFIKFLSDSRNDAYRYIDEVQQKITNLAFAWNHHNVEMKPSRDSEKKLYDAYSDLIKMLPEEDVV